MDTVPLPRHANDKAGIERLLGIARMSHVNAGLWRTYAHADKWCAVKVVGDVQGKPAKCKWGGLWGSCRDDAALSEA